MNNARHPTELEVVLLQLGYEKLVNKIVQINGLHTVAQLLAVSPHQLRSVGKKTQPRVQECQAKLAAAGAPALIAEAEAARASSTPRSFQELWDAQDTQVRQGFEAYCELGTYELVAARLGTTKATWQTRLTKPRKRFGMVAKALLSDHVRALEAGNVVAMEGPELPFLLTWHLSGQTVTRLRRMGGRVMLEEAARQRGRTLYGALAAKSGDVRGEDPALHGLAIPDAVQLLVHHSLLHREQGRRRPIRVHRSGRISLAPHTRLDHVRWLMFSDGQAWTQGEWQAMLPPEHRLDADHTNPSNEWKRLCAADTNIKGRNRKSGRKFSTQGEDVLSYAMRATPADLDFITLEAPNTRDALLHLRRWLAKPPAQHPVAQRPQAAVSSPLVPAVEVATDPVLTEGERVTAEHQTIRRNRSVVVKLKQEAWDRGVLRCAHCGFDPRDRVEGVALNLASRLIEAHHRAPLSATEGARSVHARDFVLLCATCHTLVHAFMDTGAPAERALDLSYASAMVLATPPKRAA